MESWMTLGSHTGAPHKFHHSLSIDFWFLYTQSNGLCVQNGKGFMVLILADLLPSFSDPANGDGGRNIQHPEGDTGLACGFFLVWKRAFRQALQQVPCITLVPFHFSVEMCCDT